MSGLTSAATWFMDSRRSLLRMHRDHEPRSVRSPGFSRSEPVEPPKGGTPNQSRFMESFHSLPLMPREHEPPRPRSSRRESAQSSRMISERTHVRCYVVYGQPPFAFAHASRP